MMKNLSLLRATYLCTSVCLLAVFVFMACGDKETDETTSSETTNVGGKADDFNSDDETCLDELEGIVGGGCSLPPLPESVFCTPGEGERNSAGQCCICPDSGIWDDGDVTCLHEPDGILGGACSLPPIPPSPVLCTPGEDERNSAGQCCICPDSGIWDDALCFDEPDGTISECSSPPPIPVPGLCTPGEGERNATGQCCICPDSGIWDDALCFDEPEGILGGACSLPPPPPLPESIFCTPEEGERNSAGQCCICPDSGIWDDGDVMCFDEPDGTISECSLPPPLPVPGLCTPGEGERNSAGQCCTCPDSGIWDDALCFDEPDGILGGACSLPPLPPFPILCTPGEGERNSAGQCCICPDSGIWDDGDVMCFDEPDGTISECSL